MNLGIIGSGMIVKEFLPQLTKLEGMRVIAIQGTPARLQENRQLCARYNVEHAVSDFKELIELDIDTAYIAVPNHLHFSYCKKALENGLNVIVEKPMTSNIKEALYLYELSKEKQCLLFEAVTTPYLKGFSKIQEWLPLIGDVKLVQSQFCQYSRRYDAFLRGEVLPVFDPEKSGGAMMDLNVYNLHMVVDLFGEPESYCYYANIENKIDTSGILEMTYPGFKAVCLGAKDCKGPRNTIIQGTKGIITTSDSANILGDVNLELYDGTTMTFSGDSHDSRAISEFEVFVSCINEKDFSLCHKMLQKSIAVSRVQTRARIEAGIHFPADL